MVMAGRPFCGSGMSQHLLRTPLSLKVMWAICIHIWEVDWMSQDLMSHFGPGDPPPLLKVSKGNLGRNREYMDCSILSDAETRDKEGWTSHRSCLSTASGFQIAVIAVKFESAQVKTRPRIIRTKTPKYFLSPQCKKIHQCALFKTRNIRKKFRQSTSSN